MWPSTTIPSSPGVSTTCSRWSLCYLEVAYQRTDNRILWFLEFPKSPTMVRMPERVFWKWLLRHQYRVQGKCSVGMFSVTLEWRFFESILKQLSGPTQYFWYRETLDISPDINTPESWNWKIALCLMLAWLMAYLCMAKGIASSGKVSPSTCIPSIEFGSIQFGSKLELR